MEEKFLYHIWDAGHLHNSLKTVSGKAIRVIYQGQFNNYRGPDFVNSIISIDGEDMQGAVEIHLNTQDWLRHSHHEDHFYNSVILHVVLQHSGSLPHTIKENGELAEILELKEQLSEDIQKLVTQIGSTPLKSGDAYCDLLSAVETDHLLSILASHGKQRFLGKVRRFNASLTLTDFDQILYEGMMEAAGYDKNKFNTLQLAQSIPFAKLKAWIADGMDLPALLSILLFSSGILAKSKDRLKPELCDSLIKAYECQGFYARKLEIDWQLFRIRPLNHPIYRIIMLGEFFLGIAPDGLLNCFLNQVEHGYPDTRLRFQRFSKLFSTPSTTLIPARALGSAVVKNIYLNIYLPIMYLYADKIADTAMAVAILESWNSFGAAADNYITRFMCRHINAGQLKAVNSKSLYQQGLMDIFYRYCRYHLCDECKQNG